MSKVIQVFLLSVLFVKSSVAGSLPDSFSFRKIISEESLLKDLYLKDLVNLKNLYNANLGNRNQLASRIKKIPENLISEMDKAKLLNFLDETNNIKLSPAKIEDNTVVIFSGTTKIEINYLFFTNGSIRVDSKLFKWKIGEGFEESQNRFKSFLRQPKLTLFHSLMNIIIPSAVANERQNYDMQLIGVTIRVSLDLSNIEAHRADGLDIASEALGRLDKHSIEAQSRICDGTANSIDEVDDLFVDSPNVANAISVLSNNYNLDSLHSEDHALFSVAFRDISRILNDDITETRRYLDDCREDESRSDSASIELPSQELCVCRFRLRQAFDLRDPSKNLDSNEATVKTTGLQDDLYRQSNKSVRNICQRMIKMNACLAQIDSGDSGERSTDPGPGGSGTADVTTDISSIR